MRVPSNMLKIQVLVIRCTELLDFHFVFCCSWRPVALYTTLFVLRVQSLVGLMRPSENLQKRQPCWNWDIYPYVWHGFPASIFNLVSLQMCSDWSQMGANSCCVFIVSFWFFSLGYFPCYLPFGAKRSNLLHLGAKSLICKLFAAFWSKNRSFWTLFAAFWTLDLLLAENSQAWFRVY